MQHEYPHGVFCRDHGVLVDNTTARLAMVYRRADGGAQDYGYSTCVIDADQQRLPSTNAALANKRIGLIGCGSVGSRIAAMLVRSGARKLELFDDDILSPGNLMRNELDWRGVGAHKAKAFQARLFEFAQTQGRLLAQCGHMSYFKQKLS